jgi:hypothetical protein
MKPLPLGRNGKMKALLAKTAPKLRQKAIARLNPWAILVIAVAVVLVSAIVLFVPAT